MSVRSKRSYSEDEIRAAIKDVKDNSMSVSAASKKHNIPFSTLRDRLNIVKVRLNINYSKETLSRAMDSIRSDGMSIRAASKEYNIPATTLRHRLKGRHNKMYGSQSVLCKEDEAHLVEWIILCGRTGYPKTKKQIRKTAGEVAKIKSNASFIKEIPTRGWFKSFQGRNPEISKRIPESIGKASASVTAEGLQNFFTLVQEQFKESHRLHLLSKPECWWNIDETVARTKKRVRKKLTFGVMSDVKIVDTVEEILQCEIEEEKQLERDQILDTEVVSDINSLEHSINVEQSSLKEKKVALKKLKDQRAAEKKESLKRKKAAVVGKKKGNGKQFKGG